MMRVRDMLRDCRAAGAAEFALVLPLVLMMLLGMFDAGRYLWTCNRGEKAAQMGVRYAVATAMVPSSLATYDFAATGGLIGGAVVPSSSFSGANCTNTTCTCVGGTCPALGFSATTFANILARIRNIYPDVTAANLQISYSNALIGFAGDPTGPDVRPLVTVKLVNMTFKPLYAPLIGRSVSLPSFQSSLTMEDGVGAISN